MDEERDGEAEGREGGVDDWMGGLTGDWLTYCGKTGGWTDEQTDIQMHEM